MFGETSPTVWRLSWRSSAYYDCNIRSHKPLVSVKQFQRRIYCRGLHSRLHTLERINFTEFQWLQRRHHLRHRQRGSPGGRPLPPLRVPHGPRQVRPLRSAEEVRQAGSSGQDVQAERGGGRGEGGVPEEAQTERSTEERSGQTASCRGEVSALPPHLLPVWPPAGETVQPPQTRVLPPLPQTLPAAQDAVPLQHQTPVIPQTGRPAQTGQTPACSSVLKTCSSLSVCWSCPSSPVSPSLSSPDLPACSRSPAAPACPLCSPESQSPAPAHHPSSPEHGPAADSSCRPPRPQASSSIRLR